MLDSLGTVCFDGFLSAKEMLLSFKHSIQERGYDLTREIMFSSVSKRSPSTKRLETKQNYGQLTVTGRTDHRGLPVMAMTQNKAVTEAQFVSATALWSIRLFRRKS